MIPHKLQLKNFLSYGADFQTIDFRPYHLIYLSGRNGHGKSALLDAMTWAVWGIARKVTTAVRADQGLLRLGQQQMAVIFDFEVNGQLYRVKREFLKMHNKPLAQLEFGMLNPETDTFIPLTDKTIRATQAKLEQTIKLDYESFINTAFLRQGNANEFSKKSPKERKEVLASILGLQQFDRLKKRALEKIKELQAQRTTLHALYASQEKQLQEKEQVATALNAMQIEMKKGEQETHALAKQATQIEKEKEQYTQLQKQHEVAQFKVKEQQEKIRAHEEQLRELVTRWRKVNKQQHKMPHLSELDATYKKKKEQAYQLDEKAKQLMKLQQAGLTIKEKVQQHKALLENKIRQAQQEIQLAAERLRLTEKTTRTALQEQITAADTLSKQREGVQQRADQLVKMMLSAESFQHQIAQFEKRKEKYYAFVAQRNAYATEQQAAMKKQEMISSDDPSCPLCEQNLSAARKKFLKNKCAKESRVAIHHYQRLLRIVPQLKELMLAQHTVLEQHKKQQTERAQLTKELQTLIEQSMRKKAERVALEKQLQQIEKEKGGMAKKEKEAQELANRILQEDKNYAALQQQLQDNEQQIKALDFSEKEQKEVHVELQHIEKERESLFVLQQELVKQQDRKEAIAKLIQHLKSYKKKLALLHKELNALDPSDKCKREIEQQQHIYETRHKEQVTMREALREKQGALLNKKEHLEKVEKEMAQHTKALQVLDHEIGDYQDIAIAAGKDGIQALLIEDAIPEVEQEANYLLSRLTHNQAHIFIESLRDLKRGGTKETLDITISDPSGIRPYELFSGGEAFRIDFALRIAISKLLARRAGTALQTLIIDEGFGSQDEEGLSLIMDAIHKVQDDFEKVIVVSHLPTMRDQFPVHFVVEKGPSGSAVQVMEQG